MTDLKSWIEEIFGIDKEIALYKKTNLDLSDKNNSLTAALAICNSSGGSKNQLIAALQKQLAPDPQEIYWDNRYPKINQLYNRTEIGKTYRIDVRTFLTPQDSTIPLVNGLTNDDKALAALLLVRNMVTYVPDVGEYWAFFYETLQNKKGDCEDGAILMANVMLASEIPWWRVRLNAGDVNGGGHCYLTYCRETDNQWVVLDWCYWPNKLPIAQRPLHKDEQNYDDASKNWGIWFSWNLKYSYGAMQTMAEMPNELFG